MRLCGFVGVRSGVALVDIGQFHRVAGHLLDLFGQGSHLLTVAAVGRRHLECEQVSQRIDRDVDLGAFAPLGTVVTGTSTAFGRGPQRAAVSRTIDGTSWTTARNTPPRGSGASAGTPQAMEVGRPEPSGTGSPSWQHTAPR